MACPKKTIAKIDRASVAIGPYSVFAGGGLFVLRSAPALVKDKE